MTLGKRQDSCHHTDSFILCLYQCFHYNNKAGHVLIKANIKADKSKISELVFKFQHQVKYKQLNAHFKISDLFISD